MREGAALTYSSPFSRTYDNPSSLFMGGIPGLGMPESDSSGDQRIVWREKTGEKTGWLRRGEKTMDISGRRCTKCGFIELYAHDEE